MIDTPILQLRRELLMRNFKKVSQLFGVIEPEQVSDRQNYEHFEGDRIVFSKLVMKDRKKPDKFLLPHRVPSDDREFAFSSRVFPKVAQIKAPYKLWHYQVKTVQKAADLAVQTGSRLYTDSASSYRALKGYVHDFVNHTQKEYARGDVHENRAECLFSLLKPCTIREELSSA